ncbi:hypothetical protein FDG2_1361 [Candidatus Protofrankia californiensis]|uniref:Uncharacterized protein n=1 Tax=Candidatus Protofrankia californiensis TaxID=1839754 RepID=A0A1C3NVF3_9ACTN|nr:hypothetical protein FDG2_1361 [Candidatus Protofrankia californiensis]
MGCCRHPHTREGACATHHQVSSSTTSLELRTVSTDDGEVVARVRYAGALDWYTLTGGRTRLHDPRDHQVVHELLVNVFDRPPRLSDFDHRVTPHGTDRKNRPERGQAAGHCCIRAHWRILAANLPAPRLINAAPGGRQPH